MEPPADTEVWVIRFQLDDRRYPTSRHSTTDQDEDSDAAHGYAHTPSSYDSAQAVPRNVQEQISRGDMPSPGQRRFDLERSQRAAKRLAKPPWEQIKDELDALRAESPSDSQMYEAKVADLARRIAAKRRRRAA